MLSSLPAGHVRLVYGCESAMYTCITFGRLRKLLFAHRWAFELEFYRHMGYEEVDEWFWDQMLECLVEEADRQDLRALWERELSLPLPQFATGADLVAMLRNVVNPLLYVFLELDQPPPTHFLPEWKEPEPKYSPRLSTEHYIVVEAVDANDKPVSGVRLELLIADGEIKSATTGSDGIARVERIQAGNVVIRVLDMDGSMWRPESGAPAQESSRGRHSVHVVQRGESLSRIAKRYGLKSWKVIWDDPKNEPLRNKRKNPNVIHPGDEVHVPGVQVFEMYRETDATHRIVVDKPRPAIAILNAHLLADHTAIGVKWPQGETTLGAGAMEYSDDTSLVLRLPDVPEHTRLALVAPPGGASEGPNDEGIA